MYRFATSNSQETHFKVHQRLNLTSIQDKLSAQMANSWASIRSFTNKQMLSVAFRCGTHTHSQRQEVKQSVDVTALHK